VIVINRLLEESRGLAFRTDFFCARGRFYIDQHQECWIETANIIQENLSADKKT
jgi:hypothetical protein